MTETPTAATPRLPGRNELRLCLATVQLALERYLNEQVLEPKAAIRVLRVEQKSDHNGAHFVASITTDPEGS